MPSKFFGNRFDKQSNNKGKNSNKKSAKNKAQNQNIVYGLYFDIKLSSKKCKTVRINLLQI